MRDQEDLPKYHSKPQSAFMIRGGNARLFLIIIGLVVALIYVFNSFFTSSVATRLENLENEIRQFQIVPKQVTNNGPYHTRSIPDARERACASFDWGIEKLPRATVIIVEHNEKRSVLLRTVLSVLERSPPSLLEQIIVVDDYSDDYVDSDIHILPKVRVIRNKERSGLIRSRIAGADAATTPVLVFLDAHCEANYNWLEPLLYRIKQDRKTVAWPVIDIIDMENFKYIPINGSDMTGGMNIESVGYIYENIPRSVLRSVKYPLEGVPSPTMPGGLFAIDRAWFYESGTYDTEMGFWGTENIEMSIRIWTCGGRIEMIPCSHVGHIFLDSSRAPKYVKESGVNNQIRLVEVWMDEYKKIFYEHYQISETQVVNAGNVDARKELRRNLQCKSFKWYHENIYPYMVMKDKWYQKGWDLWKKN